MNLIVWSSKIERFRSALTPLFWPNTAKWLGCQIWIFMRFALDTRYTTKQLESISTTMVNWWISELQSPFRKAGQVWFDFSWDFREQNVWQNESISAKRQGWICDFVVSWLEMQWFFARFFCETSMSKINKSICVTRTGNCGLRLERLEAQLWIVKLVKWWTAASVWKGWRPDCIWAITWWRYCLIQAWFQTWAVCWFNNILLNCR